MPFYTVQDVGRFFLNPLFPVFFIGLILLFKKERTRFGLLLLLVYLYGVSIPYTSQIVMARWYMKDTVDRQSRYDAAVVPGGMVDYKWYVKHAAENKEEIFKYVFDYQQLGQSSARILMGAAAIKSGLADTLLLSDVSIKGVHETKILLDLLERQGIDAGKIAVHGKVYNTLAEAKSVKAYCESKGIKRLLLITSANHMRRAAALFRKQGLNLDLLSVSRDNRPITRESFVPSGDGLEDTYWMLYEIVGYTAYLIQGKL
ncbi:MAG: YdcF family protein [Desulfobulbaceae bacterium]|nr:YdcF family protein [Desulfobulbaceae bacterium]HIJ89276.1 YdcF family protein [Deltaproteobacteria bacterium]